VYRQDVDVLGRVLPRSVRPDLHLLGNGPDRAQICDRAAVVADANAVHYGRRRAAGGAVRRELSALVVTGTESNLPNTLGDTHDGLASP
jgi:hypothetical protein